MAAQTSEKKRKPIGANETFWGYLFLMPVIIGFIVFTVFPVVMSFYYSLTNYDGVTPPKFVGVQNYIDLFTNGDFGEALWHTVYFTIGTVPLGTLLAILVAVFLNQKIRGANLYKTCLLYTSQISVAGSVNLADCFLLNDNALHGLNGYDRGHPYAAAGRNSFVQRGAVYVVVHGIGDMPLRDAFGGQPQLAAKRFAGIPRVRGFEFRGVSNLRFKFRLG